MSNRCALLFFILCSSLCKAQTLDSNVIRKARLITEIKQSDRVESYNLGFAGSVSDLCLKVDSLFNDCQFNEIVSFWNDTSYVLKFYSYQSIAMRNDSLAFENLKNCVSDSTLISTHITCMIGSEKFNELLIQEYARCIKYKYFYGGVIMRAHKEYRNGKPSRKLWRKKRKELIQLLTVNHINLQTFEYLLK